MIPLFQGLDCKIALLIPLLCDNATLKKRFSALYFKVRHHIEMANELKQEAELLRVCLITGCYKSSDVIEWADKRIVNDKTPNNKLIELSLTEKPQNILTILTKLSEGSDTL